MCCCILRLILSGHVRHDKVWHRIIKKKIGVALIVGEKKKIESMIEHCLTIRVKEKL